MSEKNTNTRFEQWLTDGYHRDAENIDEELDDHEVRITRNEKFRYLVTGALMVVSFMLGSGFIAALFMNIVGI